MDRQDSPKPEPEAVTDAAFEAGPIKLPRPRTAASNPIEPAPAALPAEGRIAYPTEDGRPPPPFEDYVRELQEEFEEQEDEGKV